MLSSDENNSNNKLLICSCKALICQECLQKHKEENEKDEKNKKHTTIDYKNKDYFCVDHNIMYTGYCHKCKK